ncbi:hypothetical protein [Ferrimonas marina]|uniref:Uncharacterized protein n=1 Tax=Ferrimonas marina TaxID=299255 RepID=A0A1M5YSW3_9GAMM|nr:hypothetical protein [Ferrimonas marina]SHI14924.1 hypothetical protein SAMN02745129_4373 [Ferrimonas marina]
MDVQISRPSQLQDSFRSYQILIDGKVVAQLKADTEINLTIPADARQLQARIDWCESPPVAIEALTSQKLVIKNAMGNGWLFDLLISPLYYITLGRKEYLTIECL